MSKDMLYLELYNRMKKNKDSDNSEAMSAYMRNKFKFFGIKAALRREISSPFLKELKNKDHVDWDFVFECWNSEYREMQYIGAEYLKNISPKLLPLDIQNIKKLILSKSWWDTIDILDRIVGKVALNYPEVNNTILEWSVDENIWLRRIAIDHQLLRKEKTNTELLEKILINNLNQSEFFINKAIGWALRDYSKTNPDWVRLFIENHRNDMSRLSIREASKYIANC